MFINFYCERDNEQGASLLFFYPRYPEHLYAWFRHMNKCERIEIQICTYVIVNSVVIYTEFHTLENDRKVLRPLCNQLLKL